MIGNTRKVLVAGCQGFLGKALFCYLTAIGVDVVGVDRSCNPDEKGHVNGDLSDFENNTKLLRGLKPDLIFHVAGLVGSSDPSKLFDAHVSTTKALLEAVSITSPNCKTVIVGSAAEYGVRRANSSPVREEEPTQPSTEYGRSKVEQSLLAEHLAEALRIDVVRVRLFNTLGEGQSSALVGGSMVERLYKTMTNPGSEFHVYDPSSERDYLDIRDIVRLLWHIGCCDLYKPKPIPINVGSGQAVSVEELASLLLKVSGLGPCTRMVSVQGAGSPSRVVANTDRLKNFIPNVPIQSIRLAESLRDMWHYQLETKRREEVSGT